MHGGRGGFYTVPPLHSVKIQVTRDSKPGRIGSRVYEKMHVLIPKRLAEDLRLHGGQRLFISKVAPYKAVISTRRRYASDLTITAIEYVTKRTEAESYTSVKIVIPFELALEMRLEKGGDVEMTRHTRGILADFKAKTDDRNLSKL